MMKKRYLSIVALLLSGLLALSLLCSCNAGGGNDMPDRGDGGYAGGAYEEYDKEDAGMGNGSAGDVLADRKIIKTVEESVQTAAYDDFLTAMKTALTECGGYISTARYSGETYYNKTSNRHAYFTLRIPADRLDGFTAHLGSLGTVSSYYEFVNDVTEAYVDVESRIAVLEAEEQALLTILGSAEKVDTMLSIRSQLLDVQSDLASLRAQLKSYDDRVAYSTVSLNVYEVNREVPVVDDPSFFEEVGATFVESLYGVGGFFRGVGVFLLGNSPVLILLAGIGVGGFFLVRSLMRRSQRRLEERIAARKTADTSADKPEDKQ